MIDRERRTQSERQIARGRLTETDGEGDRERQSETPRYKMTDRER